MVGPSNISASGWRAVLRRVVRSAFRQDLLGVSAGVAFYAWYASVFGLVFLVSVYGLVAPPEALKSRSEALNGLLPESATRFLADQMQAIAAASKVELGAGLGGALLVALWCARSAMATLTTALNIVYGEREQRPFWPLQAVTLALTAGAVLLGTAALALIVLVPVGVDELPLGEPTRTAISVVRWPILAILMTLALAALYRYGPCRRARRWRWVSTGAAVATALWLLGSWTFSYYITHLAADAVTWSALSAVLVLQTWFYITAFAVLLGAKVNVEAEQLVTRALEGEQR